MTEVRKSEIERLSSLFEDLSPELERKVTAKMIIAAKIDDARKRQNLNKGDLAIKFKKSASEISKWLSGNHNFTIDTLVEIERVLDIELLTLEEKSEYEIVQYVRRPESFVSVHLLANRFLEYGKKLPTFGSHAHMIFDDPIKMQNFVEHDEE